MVHESKCVVEEFRLAREMALCDTLPGFIVRLSRPYYIGKFEVTQEQWQRVMGSNPSVFHAGKVDHAGRHPVENVTWEDAREFLRRLSGMEKGEKYRLPSEFEWEYAARAGAEGDITQTFLGNA